MNDYVVFRDPDTALIPRAQRQYLAGALPKENPAILEWDEEESGALRMTLADAKEILNHLMQRQQRSGDPFYRYRIDPPVPIGDA